MVGTQTCKTMAKPFSAVIKPFFESPSSVPTPVLNWDGKLTSGVRIYRNTRRAREASDPILSNDRILVRPVPRVFWPEKPVDPGFDLPPAVGVEGVSYSYSVIGELYMSLGFIGIALGGWFYGRVAAMARGLLRRSQTLAALLMYSVVVMALFSGMRSTLELVLVSYVVLAWIAISKVFAKLFGSRRRPQRI